MSNSTIRPKRAGFLGSFAKLASVVSPSRLGTASPLSASPLSAAPTAVGPGALHSTNLQRLRRSLRACTAEGLIAEVIGACAGGAILTAWAIHLKASTFVTGAILALSQLAQLFQFPAAWTTSWLGHRRACIWLVAASRQAMLPLALLPFLPLSDVARQKVLLVVAALSAVLSVLGNNAWVSWMSELVPKRVRGRYFGRRTALCTLGGALAAAGAGVLLDFAKAHGHTGSVLAGLQIVGCVCGIASVFLMLRQHDPSPARTVLPLRLSTAIVALRDPTARPFMLYLVAWNGAVGLAGSFFALHMLQNLKMGYTLVAVHGTALALVRMLAAPVWGGLLDRLGARPVLLACSFGISTIPFIWLFPNQHFLWPLMIDAVVTGVLWCGHSLALFNLPLAITPRATRPMYLATFASLSGLAFSLATLAGGVLAELVPDQFVLAGHTFCDLHVVFALSGGLRIAAAFLSLQLYEPSAQSVDALWAELRERFPLLAHVRIPALRAREVLSPANDNGVVLERAARDKSVA